mmetsp:Transcript_6263/g.17323  ORF Transcript_6263/g.17323 Transcript_6263/m.17323 type:complete len:216 (+) Transcript_6263:1613-2260(+)
MSGKLPKNECQGVFVSREKSSGAPRLRPTSVHLGMLPIGELGRTEVGARVFLYHLHGVWGRRKFKLGSSKSALSTASCIWMALTRSFVSIRRRASRGDLPFRVCLRNSRLMASSMSTSIYQASSNTARSRFHGSMSSSKYRPSTNTIEWCGSMQTPPSTGSPSPWSNVGACVTESAFRAISSTFCTNASASNVQCAPRRAWAASGSSNASSRALV